MAPSGARPLVVQAGAGLCAEERGNLVVKLVELFGGCSRVNVLAVDPTPWHIHDLREDTIAKLSDASCVGFLQLALSSFDGTSSLYGFGSVRSLRPTGLEVWGHHDTLGAVRGEPIEEAPVSVRTLRRVLEEHFDRSAEEPHVELLIIDTEGHEWDVMEGLLDEDGRLFVRPAAAVLEYGLLWSKTTRAAQQPRSVLLNATVSTVEDMDWPSLKGVVRWFERQGYSAYMLGSQRLVPLNGPYWHDTYEVCRAPHANIYRGLHGLYNGWCWFDVVFLDTLGPLPPELVLQLGPQGRSA